LSRQADFPWPLDGDLLALLVWNSLADLPGLVGTDLLGTSGADFAWNCSTLLGRERMALLLTLNPAILLGQLLAVLLVNAHLLGHIMTDLFVLGTAVFPWNVSASLPWLISANLMRHLAADFLGLVVADGLVVNGGADWFSLIFLGQLLLDLFHQLLLDVTLGDPVLVQLVDELVKLALDLAPCLGVEANDLLTEISELSVVFSSQLVIDLFERVAQLLVDLIDLVTDLGLEETDLVQQLVLQRLVLGDLDVDLRFFVQDWSGQGKWDLATDLFGGSGAFLGVFSAADALVGHGALPVLQSGADGAWRSLALTLTNGLAFGLVHAVILPHKVAIWNRQHLALVLQFITAALLVPDAAVPLLNGLTRPEGLDGTLITVNSLALLLPNVVVNGVASLGILVLLVLEKLETGS